MARLIRRECGVRVDGTISRYDGFPFGRPNSRIASTSTCSTACLVDILQPYLTFNKKNTYSWYGKMAYKLPPDHDVTNREKAFELALEWEERIPLGVLYRKERPTFGEMHPQIPGPPRATAIRPKGR